MPTVTDTPIQGYAHCVSPRCEGSNQEPVDAIRKETAHTYRERGGNSPGVESSSVYLSFANSEDRPCPHCGRQREVADSPRPSYDPLSGYDPMGLLGSDKFDPRKQNELRQEIQAQGVDPEKLALEQQNAMLMKRLTKLEAAQEKEPDEVG